MKVKTCSWTAYTANNRGWIFHFHFVGWLNIQLGIHINFEMQNIEIHLPFCFFRIGKESGSYIVRQMITEKSYGE